METEKKTVGETAGGKENDNEVSAKGRLNMVTIGVVCLCARLCED